MVLKVPLRDSSLTLFLNRHLVLPLGTRWGPNKNENKKESYDQYCLSKP